MPRIVNHDARRREVASIAGRLIAASGLERVTIRDIAREAGFSTAIVSHYFQNKHELLMFVYRTAQIETIERVRSRRDGGAGLQKCLEEILPLDRQRRDNWKIWFSFWGMAMEDAHFMAAQRTGGREARRLIVELIETASDIPAASRAERDTQARRLLAMVSGIASQATYDPNGWSAARQSALLAAEIASLA